MSELSALEARLEAALAAIQEALVSSPAAVTDGDANDGQIAALQAENARLGEKLDALRSKRQQDIADLDALLKQLEPLIEEVG